MPTPLLLPTHFYVVRSPATYLGIGCSDMTTFHPFPLLPAELRVRIWEMTVEPRTVEVRILRKDVPPDSPSGRCLSVPHLFSSTPVPATLQTCQEARNQGLYQQAFSDLAVCIGAPNDSERRYVWLNLDIDMVSIGTTDFSCFLPIAPLIKRLKFEREISAEYFVHSEIRELHSFSNVTEIYVVCADGMRAWHGATEDYYWPCGNENVFMINLEDGQILNSIEMDEKYDRMLEEEYRQENPGDQVSFKNGYPVELLD